MFVNLHFGLLDEAPGGHGGEKGIAALKSSRVYFLRKLLWLVDETFYFQINCHLTTAYPYPHSACIANLLMQGQLPIRWVGVNSTDPILKDSWRLEGSQDKKDWRRTTPDVDISRCWCSYIPCCTWIWAGERTYRRLQCAIFTSKRKG